jgi:hypothetical protein
MIIQKAQSGGDVFHFSGLLWDGDDGCGCEAGEFGFGKGGDTLGRVGELFAGFGGSGGWVSDDGGCEGRGGGVGFYAEFCGVGEEPFFEDVKTVDCGSGVGKYVCGVTQKDFPANGVTG